MFRLSLSVTMSLLASSAAMAQSPYAGMQARPIKALSDQQVADLEAGRGMGLALPAERNGYPGPSHLLELASQLGLSDGQRTEIKALFEAMKAEAIAIGERLLKQEAALDALFANRVATPENVGAVVAAIADTQGGLRNAHLKYHLLTVALLRPDQTQRYGELRGYGDPKAPQHRHH